jgi:hypothetical protein
MVMTRRLSVEGEPMDTRTLGKSTLALTADDLQRQKWDG